MVDILQFNKSFHFLLLEAEEEEEEEEEEQEEEEEEEEEESFLNWMQMSKVDFSVEQSRKVNN